MRLFTEHEVIAIIKAVARAEREARNRPRPLTTEELARLVCIRLEEGR